MSDGPVAVPGVPQPAPARHAWRRHHHDDEYIDEISIKTVPRYKTSGLSGNEWRVSAHVEFRRKGHVVWYASFGDVETAAIAIPWFRRVCGEGPDGKNAREFNRVPDDVERSLCQQPGCSDKAINTYRFKALQISPQAVDTKPNEDAWCDYQTWFCDRHSRRGDCGIEDCDENLARVSGSGLVAEHADDESPSVLGGVVHVNPDDDIVAAIKAARKAPL